MRNYCTLSDKNYLAKGLALYRSLVKYSTVPWNLDYLCLDQESYETLTRLNLPGLTAYSLTKLELSDERLRLARSNRPYNEYCWTLASHWLHISLPKYDLLTYVDSDIVFYDDPDKFFIELGNASVGLTAHRHNTVGDRDGAYNVGVNKLQK